MHRIAVWFIVLPLFASGCVKTRAPETPVEPFVRVMTYNLDRNSVSPGEAILVIQREKPDIVCFQEASPSWQQLLRESFARDYAFMQFSESRDGYGFDGMGVASRFPIVEHRVIPPSGGGWFPAQVLILQTPIGALQILNVHLHPPIADNHSRVLGFFSTGRTRRSEIEALYRNLKPDMPTIILGDFNESDSGSAVLWLTSLGYTDALAEFDRKSTTWQGSYLGLNLRERADHVMYSNPIRCFEAHVVKEKASDHDPVVVTVGTRSK